MGRDSAHERFEAAPCRFLPQELTNMERQFAMRPLALALMLCAASSAAYGGDLKPDSLLAVDMNRSAVINNIVQTWQGQLTPENEKALRNALAKMRADRLLAAALAPSLDSVHTIMKSEESAARPTSRRGIMLVTPTATDLAYNPVAPCRIGDTRLSQGGSGPLLVDVLQDFGTISPLVGQGGTAGCDIPAGVGAVVLQMGVLQPPGLGYLAGGQQGEASYPNSLMVYEANGSYTSSVTMPLNAANGEFTLVARVGQTDAYMDVLGYFAPPAIGPSGPTGPTGPTGSTGPTGASGADGAIGPQGVPGLPGAQGAQGIPGVQGVAGITGAAGTDGATGSTGATGSAGNTVLNGVTGPTAGIGVDGDFFIDTLASLIYGPKVTGAWPITGTSLVGPTGEEGDPGATGATGAPGLAGANGTDGAAGAPGAIGPQGLTGLQGIQGVQGVAGVTGAAGAEGATGSTGATGSAGNTVLNGVTGPTAGIGANGDFFIDTLAELIYGPKAGDVWPTTGTSLVGPTGEEGDPGATGATGGTGPQGIAGATGSQGIPGLTGAVGGIGPQGLTGMQGIQGLQGIAGVTGASGANGATGPTGATGSAGNTVLNGVTGPTAGIGVDGDFFIDTLAELIYGPKAGDVWPTTGTSLVGPTGTTGAAGAIGATGDVGPQGPIGPIGPTGAAGTNGTNGTNGATGATGPTGPTGPTGAAGALAAYHKNSTIPVTLVGNTSVLTTSGLIEPGSYLFQATIAATSSVTPAPTFQCVLWISVDPIVISASSSTLTRGMVGTVYMFGPGSPQVTCIAATNGEITVTNVAFSAIRLTANSTALP
jgi:collagen triple helix repeat protein